MVWSDSVPRVLVQPTRRLHEPTFDHPDIPDGCGLCRVCRQLIRIETFDLETCPGEPTA